MKTFIKSVKYALEGIKISLTERNMKIHVFFGVMAILLGFLLKISYTDWCIILICIAAVLSLEMLNTSIEHLVDLVCPHQDEKAAKIKDLAAGAVLVFSIFALIIGLIVFLKPLLNFF